MTSYILYKREIMWLMKETGFINNKLMQKLGNCNDSISVCNELVKKGVLYETDGRYSIERTFALLMLQLSQTVFENETEDGTVIYKCPKMYIVLSEDMHNAEKLRITPIRNREQTEEYIAEHSLKLKEVLK